jgi:hypothetical protein
VHQRADVADRTDVDLRTRQEGHGAVEIDGEAALDLVEDDARRRFSLALRPSSSLPQLSSRRALSRDRTASPSAFSMRSRIDFDVSPTLMSPSLAGAEFLQRHAAFGLQADVDDARCPFRWHQRPGDGTVGQPGIEMMEAVTSAMRRDKRALAGGGGSIDRNRRHNGLLVFGAPDSRSPSVTLRVIGKARGIDKTL